MQVPEKLYFKIGEVARLAGVEPYVLRYWQTEFREIAPIKSRTNQRLYRRQDVAMILKIKELLYRERYTIEGAKRHLRETRRAGRRQLVRQLPLHFSKGEKQGDSDLLAEIRTGLKDLAKALG